MLDRDSTARRNRQTFLDPGIAPDPLGDEDFVDMTMSAQDREGSIPTIDMVARLVPAPALVSNFRASRLHPLVRPQC